MAASTHEIRSGDEWQPIETTAAVNGQNGRSTVGVVLCGQEFWAEDPAALAVLFSRIGDEFRYRRGRAA